MAKKYLNLDEAAELLGISEEELKRVRERGDLRGFSDRATWKFKQEDVEEYARRRQADSDPEVQIYSDSEIQTGDTPGSSTVLGDDDDIVGDQATVVRGSEGFLQGTSDSDVRLILDDSLTAGDDASDPEISLGESDSDVRLVDDAKPIVDSGSDSDVQLVGSDTDSDVRLASAEGKADKDDSDSDVQLVGSDTDSDVRLSSPKGESLGDTDSDVELMGSDSDDDVTGKSESSVMLGDSDSDVQLVPSGGDSSNINLGDDASGILLDYNSDSDVRLVAEDESGVRTGSESDVKLGGPIAPPPGSESEIALTADGDSEIKLGAPDDDDAESVLSEESDLALSDSSGVGLGFAADSGISLESGDSGISLETADSGISLEDSDAEGISVDGDSGIALDVGDSGIALEGLAESGISLSDDDSAASLASDSAMLLEDSGISLEGADAQLTEELEGTVPMFEVPEEDDSFAETNLEVPLADGESEFEFAVEDDEEGAETSVLLFDEDDDIDESAATFVKGSDADIDEEDFDSLDSASDTFDLDDEGDDDSELTDYDLEVTTDSSGEMDELEELDVFDEGGESFDDDFEPAESGADFIAPLATAGRVAAPVEADWGAGTVVGLGLSSLALGVVGVVMFDLVRSMWAWQDPSTFNSALLDFLGSYF